MKNLFNNAKGKKTKRSLHEEISLSFVGSFCTVKLIKKKSNVSILINLQFIRRWISIDGTTFFNLLLEI